MLLSRLLRAVPAAHVSGPIDLNVGGIAYDSRRVTPGALFVAMPSVSGKHREKIGEHVVEAAARGAIAVVVPEEEHVSGITAIRVPDSRAALADIAAEFFDHPSLDLQLFAVTGTDGKTTTTYLLEQILSRAGLATGLIGTVETKIGNRRVPNLDRMTTPESLDVQRLLREMVDAGVSHVAVEASSHAIALDRLRGCTFAAAALTNITADHVEFHGSWEAYFSAKARLFTELARGRPAVLNRDDAHFERLAAMLSGPAVTYGLADGADLLAGNVEITADGSRCMVRWRGETTPMEVPVPGSFNLANALAATGLALTAGLPLRQIAQAVGTASPPPGRLQQVEAGQAFDVFVDYAHTINGFRSVLSSLRARTQPPGKLIAVFGAAGDRDRHKRPILAQVAREYSDFFIITNEDPFSEEPDTIVAEIAAGVPSHEKGRSYDTEPDRGRAIELALKRAGPGDTVVILGKGHEQSIVGRGQKQPWSDVQAVQELLGVRQ